MPHYRLVPVGRHDSQADEIILTRHDDSGEVEHAISTSEPREIPEHLLDAAYSLAGRLGYQVVETAPPEEDESQTQEPGADSAAQSPAIKQTGVSASEIDQQATAGRAAQQDTGDAATGGTPTTTSGGTPGTSATTGPTTAGAGTTTPANTP